MAGEPGVEHCVSLLDFPDDHVDAVVFEAKGRVVYEQEPGVCVCVCVRGIDGPRRRTATMSTSVTVSHPPPLARFWISNSTGSDIR